MLVGEGKGDYANNNSNELVNPGQRFWKWRSLEEELRGTPQQVADAAKSFKVFYQQVKGSTPDGYLVDHTAGSYVFDPQGRVRLFARYGMPVPDLAADIRKLLAGG